MGISNKCFELLENRPTNYDLPGGVVGPSGAGGVPGGGYGANDGLLSDDESDATEDDDSDEVDPDPEATESEASDDDPDDDDDDDSVQCDKKAPKLRLREILYYDDKVSIFKARHGRI